jgi:exopolysaccharide biosynthesis polyprenyl glycosylphosphotransferase
MSAFDHAAAFDLESFTPQERGVARSERDLQAGSHRRGWLVRRALLAADITALLFAFLLADLIGAGKERARPVEIAVFVLTIPVWVIAAKLYGLYERDEERVDHSTIDEVVGVFHLVTLGTWFYFLAAAAGTANADISRLVFFWLIAIFLVTTARGVARVVARRSPVYLQNTIIVGAGDIGQLAARKLVQHPEYGINLVGFLDTHPRMRRVELDHVALLGSPDKLMEIVKTFDIERVIIAFSEASHDELLLMIRELRALEIQVDIVPRLFEIVGPKAGIHAFEGLALVGLPPAKLSPSSRFLKRIVDCVVAVAMLVLLSPVILVIAVCILIDDGRPIFFRQRRLGYEMHPFTVFKFRTMRRDVDQDVHKRYIEQTLTHEAAPTKNGLYKLERGDAITRVGRFLRKTSLDELPQLFNVLAGDMSLVGPRPCLDYETEGFSEHHFERFLVPPGITGLWQVTARARSTFGEALDMDVEYVRGWSLSLDLQLLFKTPSSMVRMRATA